MRMTRHEQYIKNKKRYAEYGKKYYLAHKERIKELAIKWKRENPEKVRISKNRRRNWLYKNVPEYRARVIKRTNEYLRKRAKSLRYEVLLRYGNGVLACVCCGNDDGIEFLSIDHVKNDGKVDRKVLKLNLYQLYKRLIGLNFPPGYQTLCYNCNMAKQFTGKGICPHKRKNPAQ